MSQPGTLFWIYTASRTLRQGVACRTRRLYSIRVSTAEFSQAETASAVTGSALPELPGWAWLIPWLTVYVIELPSLHWLWGFALWHGGSLGLLLPLVLYLALGAGSWLLGWIIEPVVSGLTKRERSRSHSRIWQFCWAAMLAWGLCGLTSPLFLWWSPDSHPATVYAWLATITGCVLGLGIAQGVVRGLTAPMQQSDADVTPSKRARSVLLGTVAMAGMVAMGHAWAHITPPRPGTTPPPNVLLVTLDTVNTSRLGLFGHEHETMPTLSRLAREGVSFTSAYAHIPLTQPSHATIFMGLQPQAIGVYENQRPTPFRHVTLAESFREAGYFTAGVPASRVMREKFYIHQGFDRWPERSAERGIRSLQWVRLSPLRLLRIVWGSPLDLALLIDDAEYSTTRALEAVEYSAHRSWFMWVHYYDPHAPYVVPRSPVGKYNFEPFETPGFDPAELGQVKELFNISYWGLKPLLGACYMQDHDIRPLEASITEIADLRRAYDAQLKYTDEWLGKLLKGLEDRGELENTLVVVTADHGEGLFDHQYFGHNFFLHQEEVHVPLIFWWPGRIAPQEVSEPVGLSDLFPTILSLARLAPPSRWSRMPDAVKGRDLAERVLATSAGPSPAPVYLQQFTFSRGAITPDGQQVLFQAVKGRTAYAANPYPGPMWKWYDLKTPMGRRTNLAGENPDALPQQEYQQFNRLQALLEGLARDIDGVGVQEINFQGYLSMAIDDAERKALESLGYISPSGEITLPDESACEQEVEQTAARKAELAASAASPEQSSEIPAPEVTE
ncbi:MAG: hypothetical protein GEEBNDBF_00610 [bacterium]|nr:hypothetical protein [bacterium]